MPRALILVENTSVPSDPRVWPECLALAAAGWDVSVICPRGRSVDTEHSVTLDGISIQRFDATESAGGAAGYVREYSTAVAQMRRLVRRHAAAGRFDVVQACTPPDICLLAALDQRRRGAGTVLDHHDLSPELFVARYQRRGLPYRGLLLAERLGFRLADVVLSPNETFRAVALRRGRKDPRDVFVVRNGPDPTVFAPAGPDPVLRRGKAHLLGYVGLMGRQDGVLEAIEALGVLAGQRDDWRAVFVGDGEVLADARAQTELLGLTDRVSFTGFVADRQRLVRTIASCDVCLSPEPRNVLNESSTLIKVAEYMSVGRAVAAFGLTETRATAGDAAAYARDDTAQSYAELIGELLDDPARRERMGREGRARVLERLSWTHSKERLLEAYDRACERGASRRRVSR